MATELPKIIRSLEHLATGYTVFEPNQVLSEKQLNGLTSYLDDQDRLTRIELLGVGIAGGLRVRLVDGKVRVGRGVGVSTDGDLLMLAADSVFDRFKPYDESAPAYPPFYDKAGTKMIKLFELVREAESDVTAQPLTAIPGKLAEMAVVMLMESYRKDKDLCTGTDCDNLGVDAINTTRLLLAPAADAATLLVKLATISAAALQLPVPLADRTQVAGAIGTTGALFKLYRAQCGSIHTALAKALPQLPKLLPEFTADLFNGDPSSAWMAKLETHRTFFATRDAGIQYYYDFLKDLVETWNALRDTLAGDDTVLCPDTLAFPKHLLLGSLSNPRELRTDFYPSPLTTHGGNAYEHARFLAVKLHVLVNTFAPPADVAIAIIPSRAEPEPLEARAIPFYYAFRDDLPIHAGWSYRKSARGEERRNPGYRAAAYGGIGDALKPLESQIGRYDFFRIEGHQGQKVDVVTKQIQDEIVRRNLPIALRAVLLNTDRTKIVVKPAVRYWDLHRLHHLLRKDVASRLDDVTQFNKAFKDRIDAEARRAGSQIPVSMSNMATTEFARTKQAAVDTGVKAAKTPLEAKSYTDYRKTLAGPAGSFHGEYQSLVSAAGDFKMSFGDMARTDFSTPFDSIMTSPHRAWLDWIDVIIDRKNEREDDRLLFDNFIKEHPGIEHFAGARPGGTFVLVYDQDARVVADFSLPYWAPEAVEDEPDEPVLTFPPIKPPISITDGFRILPRFDDVFDFRLDDFKKKIQPEWQREINIQKDYFGFFKDSVGAFSQIVAPKTGTSINVGAFDPKITDRMLGFLVTDVNDKTVRVEQLRDMALDQKLPPASREKVRTLLAAAEGELGTSIGNATRHVVETKAEIGPASDGGKALAVLQRGMSGVAEARARKALGESLKKAQPPKAEQPEAFEAINNMLQLGGF